MSTQEIDRKIDRIQIPTFSTKDINFVHKIKRQVETFGLNPTDPYVEQRIINRVESVLPPDITNGQTATSLSELYKFLQIKTTPYRSEESLRSAMKPLHGSIEPEVLFHKIRSGLTALRPTVPADMIEHTAWDMQKELYTNPAYKAQVTAYPDPPTSEQWRDLQRTWYCYYQFPKDLRTQYNQVNAIDKGQSSVAKQPAEKEVVTVHDKPVNFVSRGRGFINRPRPQYRDSNVQRFPAQQTQQPNRNYGAGADSRGRGQRFQRPGPPNNGGQRQQYFNTRGAQYTPRGNQGYNRGGQQYARPQLQNQNIPSQQVALPPQAQQQQQHQQAPANTKRVFCRNHEQYGQNCRKCQGYWCLALVTPGFTIPTIGNTPHPNTNEYWDANGPTGKYAQRVEKHTINVINSAVSSPKSSHSALDLTIRHPKRTLDSPLSPSKLARINKKKVPSALKDTVTKTEQYTDKLNLDILQKEVGKNDHCSSSFIANRFDSDDEEAEQREFLAGLTDPFSDAEYCG